MSSPNAPTVTLLLIDTDPQPLVASIIAAPPAPAATTYLLNCPPGTDGNACGVYDLTLISAPPSAPTPTLDMQVQPDAGGASFSIHCDLSATTSADTTLDVPTQCVVSAGGAPTTATAGDLRGLYDYLPVTVTAGAEKLGASGAGATATAATMTGGVVAATTGTGVVPAQSSGAAVRAGGVDVAGTGSVALLGMLLGRIFA